MEITKNHNKAFLNVAFAYTCKYHYLQILTIHFTHFPFPAREEMSHAVQQVALGIKKKYLKEEDVDEKLIERGLYTHNSPSPDLLIRTSGEVRLSDFLLWQTSYSSIYFTNVLWPEFSLKDLCLAILHYQRNLPKIKVSIKLIFLYLWISFSLQSIKNIKIDCRTSSKCQMSSYENRAPGRTGNKKGCRNFLRKLKKKNPGTESLYCLNFS